MSSLQSASDAITEYTRDIALYRRLLVIAGGVYLGWWLGIHLILPNAFNPLPSRLAVVTVIFAIWGLSFVSAWVRARVRLFLIASTWLITLHFYFLFYENGGDANWVIGSYITVIAINLCLLTAASLLSYSVYVTVLSALMAYLLPHLRDSIFLPGLLTILVQANMGLRARASIIRNLIASNERFQLLFHATFDGIIVHEGGKILTTNESMSQISGFSREELVGRSVLDILAPEERATVQVKLGQDEVIPYETHGLRKDGRITDVEVRAKNFQYDGRSVRLVTIQDISDRKKADRERVKALTAIENLRVRDEFISIASHELKTPISSLKLQTQMIERDLKHGVSDLDTPEKIADVMALFHRQIDRLTELVESMLDVSRISAGRFTLDLADVDLAELARQSVKLMSVHTLSTGAPPIEVRVPQSLVVKGDRRRLQQVIENMLSNSLKYGNRKPISVELRTDAAEAQLIFRDHGLGIAPEFLPRIFDRFERAISARNISGLGLGLYITRQIVESHGGTVSVTSDLGVGSVFTVHLPIAAVK